MSSLKAAFHLPPQNWLREVATAGKRMIGLALIPAERQSSESRWKNPKCSAKANPTIPSQPASRGFPGGMKGTMPQTKATPNSVFAVAINHSRNGGTGTEVSARNVRAFMPGQKSKYASNLRQLSPGWSGNNGAIVSHFAPL